MLRLSLMSNLERAGIPKTKPAMVSDFVFSTAPISVPPLPEWSVYSVGCTCSLRSRSGEISLTKVFARAWPDRGSPNGKFRCRLPELPSTFFSGHSNISSCLFPRISHHDNVGSHSSRHLRYTADTFIDGIPLLVANPPLPQQLSLNHTTPSNPYPSILHRPKMSLRS